MDYLQAVSLKEAELSDLYTRMDDDKDLLYLKKYTVKDRYNRAIPGIINVTLNDPAVFSANVIASLGATKQQIVVESEAKKLDTGYIEQFQKAALDSANDRLRRQGKPLLNAFFDEQLCIRGRAGARCLFREEAGVLIPDILPLDTRYLTYEIGTDGLVWAAYKTLRSKALINSEYGVNITGNHAIVLDVWDGKVNEIWIEGRKRVEQENPYGYVPFVIQVVSLGSMLQDKDSLSHHGESILFLIRDIIPELNRLVSILQTLNMSAVKAPKQYASLQGTQADVKAVVDAGFDEMGALTAIDVGGGISLVPIADIKRSASLLHSMMETRMQRGSVSAIDLGNLAFPLSAVALVEIGRGREQVFLPRLQAKAILNQELAEMFTSQVIEIGGSVELGTKGHKRNFETQKLQGEYETTYRYFTKSPTIDVARYSVAAAAARYFDKRTILTDVLEVEDADTILKRRYDDLAEMISPTVLKIRVIKSLAEEGKDFEAELLAKEVGLTIDQILEGKLPEAPMPALEPPRAPEAMLPLLGEGERERPTLRGITPARQAAELKRTPRTEVGGEE